MVAMLTVAPVYMSQFTKSYVITPILTFAVTFGFLMIHCVSIQLEAPFGEDDSDLPLLEMHAAFNDSLLAFAYVAEVEAEVEASATQKAAAAADSTAKPALLSA